MGKSDWGDVPPPAVQRVLQWYVLLLEAEFGRIESVFRERFANVGSEEVVGLVEKFHLERLDTGATWLSVVLGAPQHSEGIHLFERFLEGAIAQSLKHVKAVFRHWPDAARQRVEFTISEKLRAKALALTAEAKFKLFHQQESVVRETLTELQSKSSSQRDTERRTTYRRRLIEKYRRDHDLTAAAFARKVGISDTAIRGIVKDDRKRFSEDTKDRLLSALGVSRERWDGPS